MQGSYGQSESHTLYIRNLNDKKNPEVLKKALHEICSAFGEIKEIIAMKSLKRKGQAWVVYNEVKSARDALGALNEFPVFDKPMKVAYARTKSDAIAKEDGSFVPRPKNTLKTDPTKKQQQGQAVQKVAGAMAAFSAQNPIAAAPFFGVGTAPPPPSMGAVQRNYTPSETLFVQQLPPAVNENLLRMLFQQYPGFKEVRHIEVKACAFVDYLNEQCAQQAFEALKNVEIQPGQKLDLSYARKG